MATDRAITNLPIIRLCSKKGQAEELPCNDHCRYIQQDALKYLVPPKVSDVVENLVITHGSSLHTENTLITIPLCRLLTPSNSYLKKLKLILPLLEHSYGGIQLIQVCRYEFKIWVIS